jgi:transcriptional regulator with XRE-family HTH domain
MMGFGYTVRQRREIEQMKQETLADKVSIKRPHLSRIENEKTVPSVDLARRIAKALGTTLSDLLGENSHSTHEVLILRETVERYQVQLKSLKQKLRTIQKTARP